jgi:hypothetical protein
MNKDTPSPLDKNKVEGEEMIDQYTIHNIYQEFIFLGIFLTPNILNTHPPSPP